MVRGLGGPWEVVGGSGGPWEVGRLTVALCQPFIKSLRLKYPVYEMGMLVKLGAQESDTNLKVLGIAPLTAEYSRNAGPGTSPEHPSPTPPLPNRELLRGEAQCPAPGSPVGLRASRRPFQDGGRVMLSWSPGWF